MKVENCDSAKALLRGLFNISVTPFGADGMLDDAALKPIMDLIVRQPARNVHDGAHSEPVTARPNQRDTRPN